MVQVSLRDIKNAKEYKETVFSPNIDMYMKFFKPTLHQSISHFFCNSHQPRFYRVSCIFYYEHNKYAVMFFKTTNARSPAPSPLVTL